MVVVQSERAAVMVVVVQSERAAVMVVVVAGRAAARVSEKCGKLPVEMPCWVDVQGAGTVVELLGSSQVQAVGLLAWSEPLMLELLAPWLVELQGAVQEGRPADAGSLVVLLFHVQRPLLVAVTGWSKHPPAAFTP